MNVFVGFVLVIALGTLFEGYFVIGRAQRLLGHAEQLFAAAAMLLALAPGKSAPRTVAPADLQPRRWWQVFGGDPARAQLVDEELVLAWTGVDPTDIRDAPPRSARIRALITRIRSHVDEDLADEPDVDDYLAADGDTQLAQWADDGGAPAADPRPSNPATTPDLRQASRMPPPTPGTPPLDRSTLDQRQPTARMDMADLALARFRARSPAAAGARHRHAGGDDEP